MNTGNSLIDYLPVLVQITLALGIVVAILTASHLFGQRAPTNRLKDSPYECGLPAEGGGQPRFAVKFYLAAMLFILFDIEIVFLIPWVLVYKDLLINNIPILGPILVFLAVLGVGLFYELRKGALDWET
jgi:NADH-quinone oxidoreductase subunit A